jgi:hypothetical protein
MMSQVEEASPSIRHTNRLLWVGPLTVLASTAVVMVVQRLAVALLSPGSRIRFSGRNQVQLELLGRSNEPAVFTVVLVSCAVLVFAVIYREAINPFRTYRRVALVALVVSFVPDVFAAVMSLFGWPLAVIYMIMHVAAWAVCVTMLTKLMV